MRNSICFIFATYSTNHIPSRLQGSTVKPRHICQLARLFSRHARLALARATLTLLRFSEVIFVLKLVKAAFLAFIVSLHYVLNQGLYRFFCFAVVLGIQLLSIIHKISVNKTIGSSYNSIVSNVNFPLHK